MTLGPLVNIHFQDITVVPSSNTLVGSVEVPFNAIYIAIADGGSMDSIYFERINVQAKSQTSIFIRLCNRGNSYDSIHTPVQYLRNVWLNDISATQTSTIPCSITGLPGYPVQNINLHNVVCTVPGGGPIGTDSIGEQPATRPEFNIWGDSLPAYGLFVRHANGLHLDSFCVVLQSPDQRAEYYEVDTANNTLINPCSGSEVNSIEKTTAKSDIKFFPNPANDLLNITQIPTGCEVIILYNMQGTIAAIIPAMDRTTMHVNTSGLAAGVYSAVARGENFQHVARVIVTH